MTPAKSSDGKVAEGVLGLVGITLGLVPLVQFLWKGQPGWWRLVLGPEPGAAGWILPAVVVLGCLIGLVVVDRRSNS